MSMDASEHMGTWLGGSGVLGQGIGHMALAYGLLDLDAREGLHPRCGLLASSRGLKESGKQCETVLSGLPQDLSNCLNAARINK